MLCCLRFGLTMPANYPPTSTGQCRGRTLCASTMSGADLRSKTNNNCTTVPQSPGCACFAPRRHGMLCNIGKPQRVRHNVLQNRPNVYGTMCCNFLSKVEDTTPFSDAITRQMLCDWLTVISQAQSATQKQAMQKALTRRVSGVEAVQLNHSELVN